MGNASFSRYQIVLAKMTLFGRRQTGSLLGVVTALWVSGALVSQVSLRIDVPQRAVVQYEPAFVSVLVGNSTENRLVAPDGLGLQIERLLANGEWGNIHALSRRMSGMGPDRPGGTTGHILRASTEEWVELQIIDLGMISEPGEYRVRIVCRVYSGFTDVIGDFFSEWASLSIQRNERNASVLDPASREKGSTIWKSYLRILTLEDVAESPDYVAIPELLGSLSIVPAAEDVLGRDLSPGLQTKAHLGLASEELSLGNYRRKRNEEAHGHYQAALAHLSRCLPPETVPRTGGLVAQTQGLRGACFAMLGDAAAVRSILRECEKYDGFLERRRGLRDLLERAVR